MGEDMINNEQSTITLQTSEIVNGIDTPASNNILYKVVKGRQSRLRVFHF